MAMTWLSDRAAYNDGNRAGAFVFYRRRLNFFIFYCVFFFAKIAHGSNEPTATNSRVSNMHDRKEGLTLSTSIYQARPHSERIIYVVSFTRICTYGYGM